MNSNAPAHVVPNGISSLIELSICSPNLLASSSLQVEEDLYDSDHFPINISVDFHAPLQPSPTLFNWSHISWEIYSKLQLVSGIDYESFHMTILSVVDKHRVTRSRPTKGLPAWWTTKCSNLSKQNFFYLPVLLYYKSWKCCSLVR